MSRYDHLTADDVQDLAETLALMNKMADADKAAHVVSIASGTLIIGRNGVEVPFIFTDGRYVIAPGYVRREEPS